MVTKEGEGQEGATSEKPSDLQLRADDPVETFSEIVKAHNWNYWIVGIGWLLEFIYKKDRTLVFFETVAAGALMFAALKQSDIAGTRRDREEKGRIPEERMVRAIRDAFNTEGVEVSHRVQIGEAQDLDIFVRFPSLKIMFAVSVKNWGEGKVVYHEKRDVLCLRQGNGGLRYLNAPDPLTEIIDHEWWLRRNNRAVFGGSSRDAKRPVRKVMAFAPPTIIQAHNDHLYAIIGGKKFVCVERGKSSVFIIAEDQLIEFIRLNLQAAQAP